MSNGAQRCPWRGTSVLVAFGLALPRMVDAGTVGVPINGRVVITPAHPGPARRGQASEAQAFDGATVVAKDAQGRAVASTRTDVLGRYRFSLPPGRYDLQVAIPGSAQWPRCESAAVRIDSAAPPPEPNLHCDSGMR